MISQGTFILYFPVKCKPGGIEIPLPRWYIILLFLKKRSSKINSAEKLSCFFVSDLHGSIDRYEKLFHMIIRERPNAVFVGGDILPSPYAARQKGTAFHEEFIDTFLVKKLIEIKESLGNDYPRFFVILGNDDARSEEPAVLSVQEKGLWEYCHFRCLSWEGFTITGYSYIPPSPFRLKDWERFDVSDFIRPGCIAPDEGAVTAAIPGEDKRTATIEDDLKRLTCNSDMNRTICLFHSPPHRCKLDRAALDGQCIDGIQIDVHVGSVAIQRFITAKQPLLTLHGHIHESTRLTGSWQDVFGGTLLFNASHDGAELSLIRFDPHCPGSATRELI